MDTIKETKPLPVGPFSHPKKTPAVGFDPQVFCFWHHAFLLHFLFQGFLHVLLPSLLLGEIGILMADLMVAFRDFTVLVQLLPKMDRNPWEIAVDPSASSQRPIFVPGIPEENHDQH